MLAICSQYASIYCHYAKPKRKHRGSGVHFSLLDWHKKALPQ